MNRRTAESAGGGQNIEVKNIVLFFFKTSAVSAGGGFDIVLRTPHPAGGSPVSIFKIQESRKSAIVQSHALLATPHRYILLKRAFAHGGAVTTVPGVSGAAL